MTRIYLSPHLDDVAFSCGGLVWEQTRSGEGVEIWTLFAGQPPPGNFSRFARKLHSKWNLESQVVVYRRAEDTAACAELGAASRHFDFPDAIYRRHPCKGKPLYTSNRALFGSMHSAEDDLLLALADRLADELPSNAEVVCPLAIGGHVDHWLSRAAAERLGRPLWYYADLPYILDSPEALSGSIEELHFGETFTVTDPALRAWGNAVAAYHSQIGMFWDDEAAMRTALKRYRDENGGLRLWFHPDKAVSEH